jgi:dolichyl-phosphate beta-glucosyltransferase
MDYFVKISIVIPCYNEAERLSQLEEGLKEFIASWGHEYEIIIVDDGSTDETSKQIQSNEYFNKLKQDGVFTFITLPENEGKGGALKAGVLDASGDFILTMDADISTHPLEIVNWKNQLNGSFGSNSIIIASRTHRGSTLIEKKHRKIIGLIFNFLVRKITSLSVRDSQCGFKLYPKSVAQDLFFNLQTNGWAHDVELLCRAKQQQINIIEQPIHWTVKDNSKIHILSDSLKMLFQIMRIRIQILNNPFRKYER